MIYLTMSIMSWFTHEAVFAAAVGSSQMYPFIIVRGHYEVIVAGRYILLAFSVVRFWLVHLTVSEIDGGWGQQPIHVVSKSKVEDGEEYADQSVPSSAHLRWPPVQPWLLFVDPAR
jgi:hypothetical protein